MSTTSSVSAADLEAARKAADSATFLCRELGELVKSANLILSDVALGELAVAGQLSIRIKRLASNIESMTG